MRADPACRSCGGVGLLEVLDLGRMPLANALVNERRLTDPEPTYPLNLVFCPACGLLQITESVPPDQLFSDYVYFSSFSETAVASAAALADRITGERSLDGNALVIEIASNDGYLLQAYQRRGVGVLGIEPARNIAATAEARGIRTLCAFFSRELANELARAGTRAHVLHANNVLAHVPDLAGVLSGMREVLAPEGVAVIEFPYVKDLVDKIEFDTIYHEHLCYFSFNTVHRLFTANDLRVVDVERIPIHGGSLRVFAVRQDSAEREAASVRRLLGQEVAWGLTTFDYYRDFGRSVEALGVELRARLHGLKADGKRIAAYGASAKGSTLLNFFNIGRDTLEYVVDRSTAKQGLFTPGTRLPIYPTEKLLEDRPDYVLLLAWNFAEEIMAQQQEYRRHGGRFIVPLPAVMIA